MYSNRLQIKWDYKRTNTNAEFKKTWIYTSIPPYVFMASVQLFKHRTTFVCLPNDGTLVNKRLAYLIEVASYPRQAVPHLLQRWRVYNPPLCRDLSSAKQAVTHSVKYAPVVELPAPSSERSTCLLWSSFSPCRWELTAPKAFPSVTDAISQIN
jgi:hypothetical protein